MRFNYSLIREITNLCRKKNVTFHRIQYSTKEFEVSPSELMVHIGHAIKYRYIATHGDRYIGLLPFIPKFKPMEKER